jgi:hypothetical protein
MHYQKPMKRERGRKERRERCSGSKQGAIIEPEALDSTSIMVDKSRRHLFSGTLVGRRGWVRVSTEIPLGYKNSYEKLLF